jgi:peptide/nickel transport system substrate-binding protein
MVRRRVVGQRFGRRRFLLAGGATAAATAFLAACGRGGERAGGPPSAGATSVTTAEATAKRGGVYRVPLEQYPGSMDIHQSPDTNARTLSGYVFSRLLTYANGPAANKDEPLSAPDVAASYEVADGGTTLIFKLRPNTRFHKPIDRPAIAEDVVISFQRALGTAPGTRPGPNAPRFTVLDSVTAPDASTVVLKLKRPYAPLTRLLSEPIYVPIMPKDTLTALDPARIMVGCGPFAMEKADQSAGVRMVRHPAWHFGPDAPYFDAVEWPVVTEYAARITQFAAGNLDTTPRVGAQDLIRLRGQVRGLQYSWRTVGFSAIAFSPKDKSAPWTDVRVRYAMSMAIDRDAMAEAIYDYQLLKNNGIDIPIRWNNFIPPLFPTYWLDPRGSRIDPNVARYYRYDPSGAKQLLTAAGYPEGFSTQFHWPPLFGRDYRLTVEIAAQMLSKIGIRTQIVEDDYASVYNTQTRQGNYDGFALVSNTGTDPGDFLENFFLPDGTSNLSRVNDPELVARIQDIQSTLNVDERREKILNIQNYLGEKMYFVPLQSSAGPVFNIYSPNLRGLDQYPVISPYGAGQESVPYWWRA